MTKFVLYGELKVAFTDLKKQAEKVVVNALLQELGNPAFVGEDHLARVKRFVAETLESFYVREKIVLSKLEKFRLNEGMIAEIICCGAIPAALDDPTTVLLELYRSGVLKIWRADSDMPIVSELDKSPRVIEVFSIINNLVLRHHLHIQGNNLPAQTQADGFTVTLMPFHDTDNGLTLKIVKQDQ
jgi:hypothetical protein